MKTYYAKIENDIVTNVIVCDKQTIKNYSGEWIQTYLNKLAAKNYKYKRSDKSFINFNFEIIKKMRALGITTH